MSPWWPGTASTDPRRQRNSPEKDVQRDCRKLLRIMGWTALHLSQPRATKQTAGLPDDLALKAGCPILLLEYKAGRNTQSDAQRRVQALCDASAGAVYLVCYSAADLAAQLERIPPCT